jgi:hypothetical protein
LAFLVILINLAVIRLFFEFFSSYQERYGRLINHRLLIKQLTKINSMIF